MSNSRNFKRLIQAQRLLLAAARGELKVIVEGPVNTGRTAMPATKGRH